MEQFLFERIGANLFCESKMKISVRLKIEKVDGGKERLVEFVVDRKKTVINLEEFNKKYSKFSGATIFTEERIPEDANIAEEIEATTQPSSIATPTIPFKGFIKDLFNEAVNNSVTNEVVIEAEEDKFLHLPWEEICEDGQSPSILKRVKNKKHKNERRNIDIPKRILVLSSAARDLMGQTQSENLSEDTKLEIDEIIKLKNQLYDSNINRRIEYIFMVRNFSIGSKIKDIPQCDILHLICHGELNGTVCISDVNRPNEIHRVDSAKFIKLLAGRKFYIGYLSLCHSGSGSKTKNSLAYELVNNGVCKYCIAFQRSISSTKSIEIAERFYACLFQHDFNVIEAYKDLCRGRNDFSVIKELRPLLYL